MPIVSNNNYSILLTPRWRVSSVLLALRV
jgi:hypothetical protein